MRGCGVSCQAVLALALAWTHTAEVAHSTPVVIVDTTPATAVNDGTIGVGEYVGSENGVNAGFGDVVGVSSRLFWDSDLAGTLSLAVDQGPGNLGGPPLNTDDTLVIYLDTRAAGFADTTALTDAADSSRAAISGGIGAPNSSNLFFAPGFTADFAVTLNRFGAFVYEIVAGGSHNLITSANLSTLGFAPADREMDLLLSHISLSPGDSFDYVGTYLNPSNGYRSNEGYGINASTFPANDPGGNPGNLASYGNASDTILGANEFSTFQSVPEPFTVLLLAGALLGIAVAGGRKSLD